jgi:hypothetical protein
MAKITFSDENQAGDIPTFEITKNEILSGYHQPFHDLIDFRNGKIIVAFQSWKNEIYEYQHTSFLITDSDQDAFEFLENHIELIKDDEIDFNLFCFDTYEDAFKYCIDLKEGL